MKVIIAGSRTINALKPILTAIAASGFEITEVVSGGAHGADQVGATWAQDNGIPVRYFDAEWTKYGRKAGPIRNRQMAEYADALLAIWDGKSRGTKNMIEEARKRNLKVYVYVFPIPASFLDSEGSPPSHSIPQSPGPTP